MPKLSVSCTYTVTPAWCLSGHQCSPLQYTDPSVWSWSKTRCPTSRAWCCKEDVNPDASTKDADGDVNRKTLGPDFACSQVTFSCVTEPICMSIPSWVTSLGRDNFNGLPMTLGESLVPMGTGKQPVPSNPVRPNRSIPEYTPDDSCSQEVFYSFESSSGQGGLTQFSLDVCSDLIGQGQSHPFSNYFDCRNQEWSPLSSTPVTKMDPDPLNWVGLV